MASIGQIIFASMIILIIVMSGLIILLLAIAFGRGGQGFLRTSTRSPVGNLGQDVLLDCSFSPKQDSKGDVSVTWKKVGVTGVVYGYHNQAPDLVDQNAEFKDRTRLFRNVMASGNASLLLQRVREQDQGEYQCSVSAPSGQGSINVHLWVAAYSAPEFKRTGSNLTADAQRWFPKPNVTWEDHASRALNGNTKFFNNSAGIFRVESTLLEPANRDDTYILVISNHLVRTVSVATVTGESGVSVKTDFTFNTASPRLLSLSLVPALLSLCLLLP
ncbi:V-set domain-containing T-cell activation inhibitor 1 [Sardina pilchardus]|uniref:V-set domain-containing T-cell activation inhibitor 1 n=1 Tax=Sardina pilchardus TaxID=27697 RepID=UPI002E0E84ED